MTLPHSDLPLPLTASAIESAIQNSLLNLPVALSAINVTICVVSDLNEQPSLNTQELALFRQMSSEKRKTQWLKGRLALQHLKQQVPELDSSPVTFPHPAISLTHSGQQALAIHIAQQVSKPEAQTIPPQQIMGVGLDLQEPRLIRERTSQRYLTPAEYQWLQVQPEAEKNHHHLRLWSLKEALYKSNPKNAGSQYNWYELQQPESNTGKACCKESIHSFYYYATETEGGFLSVTLATE